MPLQIPNLDDRRYQELLDEALARIPVHTPEWTNFNSSDPGVTLIQLFAFMMENVLYRSNLIPERNRLKFLTLLGIGLQPVVPAQGLVALRNERGPLETITINRGIEMRAGAIPFRTTNDLDVLPVEAQVYYKRELTGAAADQMRDYYLELYTTYAQPGQTLNRNDLSLYETVLMTETGVDISETTDSTLWMALLARPKEDPADVRQKIAGKTISLGVVPILQNAERYLSPTGTEAQQDLLMQFYVPRVDVNLRRINGELIPDYGAPLPVSAQKNVLVEPGLVSVTLPEASQLDLWENLEPLDRGVNNFPPSLEDSEQEGRIVTWLRITFSTPAQIKWIGINAATVIQREDFFNELVGTSTAEPDQRFTLANGSVIQGSTQVLVGTEQGQLESWAQIDDLSAAAPEIMLTEDALAGSKVFALEAETGTIRFGDGTHGARPPFGANIYASYSVSRGRVGNVNAGAINNSPALPAGFKIANPVATWGGADAESPDDGEKQITRYLQHRDRLVNMLDYETITLRTPGVNIGRVDVLPAFNPHLSFNQIGSAPGAVTLMVIPSYDAQQPDAPMPDRLFLKAICDYLEPRRLVTTELFVRGPEYLDIYVSVGVEAVPGFDTPAVREAIRAAVQAFLSPLPPGRKEILDAQTALLSTPELAQAQRGWPLRKAVNALEVQAVVSRVPGVLLVRGVLIAEGLSGDIPIVPIERLQLPRLAGIQIVTGLPLSIDEVRGGSTPSLPSGGRKVSVPVVPEVCR
jgi:hypothetical protein